MCKLMPVGEDEVIKKNMELAQKKNHTAEDILNLPKDVRAELIDGQIFYFASPKLTHQRLIGNLYYRLRRHLEENQGTCEVIHSPTAVRLEEISKNYLEPDLIVVCDPDKLKEDGCYGPPDLVIEVASKSTQRRDYGLKVLKYRTAGVKEYWIIDPDRQTIMVYWFEDECLNNLYHISESVEFHLFPGLAVDMSK